MAANVTGVQVYVDKIFDKSTPWCAHGPTLLFERLTAGSSIGQRFFACSASRERKDCSIFQWEDAKVSTKVVDAQQREYIKSRPPYTAEQYYKRKETFKGLSKEEQNFCKTCGLLLLPQDKKAHFEHDVQRLNDMEKLLSPTLLLLPLENNKTNAQYLFSEQTVDLFEKTIQKLGFTKVLCLGTPRIHEAMLKHPNTCKSMLLDMDHRLGQFFAPSTYCRYNMFNHHFFEGEESKKNYTDFLQAKGKLLVIADPPFGGLVAVLANTLKLIEEDWKKVQKEEVGEEGRVPVMFIFPYFMEKKVKEHMEGFTMLDYKVDYTNHSSFHSGRSSGGKHGSPVRIFTTISPASIPLPTEEGYRFCSICERWVSQENKHCKICNCCTSKDGRTYVHCELCERCVKPSYEHCNSCGYCSLPDHKCGGASTNGCYVCGDISHKKNDCPNKPNKKRKQTNKDSNQQKPKKGKWWKKTKKQKKQK